MMPIIFSGCAVLHHIQIGEIDNRKQFVQVPIEVLVSEMGFDMGEAKNLSQSILSNQKAKNDAAAIADTIALFQIGPRTGAPIYNEKYAEKIIYHLHTKCPQGQITEVQSIRETREYPVIKGEIVKIVAQCLREKKGT